MERLVSAAEAEIKVAGFTSSASALLGTTVCVDLARVGGLTQRLADAEFAEDNGVLAQETHGFCGLVSSLRNARLSHRLAVQVQDLAPSAWLVIVSNPVGIVTQAATRVRPERTVGICEMPWRMLRAVRDATGEPGAECLIQGLNHLSFVVAVRSGDSEILDSCLRVGVLERIMAHASPSSIPNVGALSSLGRVLGVVPNPYLRYFYFTKLFMRGEHSGALRASQCLRLDSSLHEAFSTGQVNLAGELAQLRGGFELREVLADLLASLSDGFPQARSVPVIRNGELCSFLDDAVALEVSRDIAGHPEWEDANLPSGVRGLLHQVGDYECLAVDASLSGERVDIVRAASSHPLIAGWAEPERLVDRYLRSLAR